MKSLWRNSSFVRLWAGQTISFVGAIVVDLAFSLTAAVALAATPLQMGILEAAGAIPALLFGLYAGVWVDRHRRRPLLIAAGLGRAVLLASIPIAAVVGMLRIEQLYVVAFLAGSLGLLAGVAFEPFLFSLVGREQLVEANGKLAVSRSVAEIAAPGLAGWLTRLFSAPIAIAVDVLSSLASAFLLWTIRSPEPPPRPVEERRPAWREAIEGVGLVVRDRTLRPLAGCVATTTLFESVLTVVYILYVTRDLGLGAPLVGLAFGVGGVGFLVGALVPGRMVRRFGLGPAIIGGLLLAAVSDLLVVAAGGTILAVVAVLCLAHFLFGIGLSVFDVGRVSLQQLVTPDPLRGRVAATFRVLPLLLAPLGGLLGGLLGETIGLRATLLVGALGNVGAVLWLLLSSLRSLREQPVEA